MIDEESRVAAFLGIDDEILQAISVEVRAQELSVATEAAIESHGMGDATVTIAEQNRRSAVAIGDDQVHVTVSIHVDRDEVVRIGSYRSTHVDGMRKGPIAFPFGKQEASSSLVRS
jgi:hypothetical protein